MKTEWPFSDPKNVATFVSKHILTGDVICHVYHSWEDGSWSFLPDRKTADGDCKIICLHNVYELDPSVGELADLPYGWKASRVSANHPWERSKDHPYPEHSEHGYYLIEVASYPSGYPDLPTQEERENLVEGSLVKLLFRFAAEEAPFGDCDTERMWVHIEHIDTDDGRYCGILDNAPKHAGVITQGDKVWFNASHVFAIHAESTGTED